MVAIVAPEDTDRALAVLTARHVDSWVLGTIKSGGRDAAKGKTGVATLVGEHPRFKRRCCWSDGQAKHR